MFTDFPAFQYGVFIWGLSAMCADMIISISLVYYLRQSKSDFKKTNDIIDRVLSLAIGTGASTTVGALLCIICFAAAPDLIGAVFQLFLAKLCASPISVLPTPS